jgi:capsular polysaccharide biosynthesis protein
MFKWARLEGGIITKQSQSMQGKSRSSRTVMIMSASEAPIDAPPSVARNIGIAIAIAAVAVVAIVIVLVLLNGGIFTSSGGGT